eukprot:gene6548-10554_t
MTTSTKVAKIYLPNCEIRRFQIQNKTFQEFQDLILSQEGIEVLNHVKYLNEENEWTEVSDEVEWSVALEQSGSMLRVKISCIMSPIVEKQFTCAVDSCYATKADNLPSDFFSFDNFKLVK